MNSPLKTPLPPCVKAGGSPEKAVTMCASGTAKKDFKKMTSEEWKKHLTPQQYYVTREAGTEPRSDVTRELRGSPCDNQGTAKFEFKSPSVHSWSVATLPPKLNFAKLRFAKRSCIV
ncbi:hypothetical protein E2C01_027007 [Portunus trituberculatus]|uniref:MsrB domain-containing protein n=1 Tax=Portunus trituberculatus TaxID=210409 RepID=A0A5B7EGT5_PORTR|nr:hypothetical protein [Portunus trituberculatus]